MTDDLTALTPNLDSLGWTAQLTDWANTVPHQRTGRIARASRGFSLVFTGGQAELAASSSVRSDTGLAPSTGDFVALVDDPEDGVSVAAVAERRTALIRRSPGRIPEPQVLAANIDDVFIMHGLDREVSLNRLERQLVIAWASGASPIVLLTKADQFPNHAEAVETISAIAAGVAVIAVSNTNGHNVDLVAQHLTGSRTIALLGLSGVGKSTLVNELSDGVVQRIGEVRATDRRGRHTTVTRDLIPLPQGGIVIDTPGVREIGLWQARDGLDMTFPELAAAAATCRFADCEHDAEPGCGVKSGLFDGTILQRRLVHWKALQAELDLQDLQIEEFQRRVDSRSRANVERRMDGERPRKSKRGKKGGKKRR